MNTPIDLLRPVGLDELIDAAALLTRVDRKYLVPPADVDVLLAALGPDTRVLELTGRRRFEYRSVYFDTPGLDSYLATARRRRLRFKIRTRSYLDSGLHVLELKTRGPRGLTVKRRLPYAGRGSELDGAERAELTARLADDRIVLDGPALRPVLVTRYQRTTLLLEAGARLTVDTGLAWSIPLSSRASVSTTRAVVETKSVGRAGRADHVLRSLGHRPVALSKFGTGLSALRPDLPGHRWRPLLRRHLDLTPAQPCESDLR